MLVIEQKADKIIRPRGSCDRVCEEELNIFEAKI